MVTEDVDDETSTASCACGGGGGGGLSTTLDDALRLVLVLILGFFFSGGCGLLVAAEARGVEMGIRIHDRPGVEVRAVAAVAIKEYAFLNCLGVFSLEICLIDSGEI